MGRKRSFFHFFKFQLHFFITTAYPPPNFNFNSHFIFKTHSLPSGKGRGWEENVLFFISSNFNFIFLSLPPTHHPTSTSIPTSFSKHTPFPQGRAGDGKRTFFFSFLQISTSFFYHYPLPTTHYPLPTTNYQLPTTYHCLLSTDHC